MDIKLKRVKVLFDFEDTFMLFMISDTNLIISCFIRGIWSFLYMVLDNRLIGNRLNWEPTIQIVKTAIRFSTTLL